MRKPRPKMSTSQFWDRAVEKYGPDLWYARALTRRFASGAPDPEVVQHKFSAGFEDGLRYWAFDTKANRDSFVKAFQSAKAEACENPRP